MTNESVAISAAGYDSANHNRGGSILAEIPKRCENLASRSWRSVQPASAAALSCEESASALYQLASGSQLAWRWRRSYLASASSAYPQ
jgi:hypothetical protein